MKGVSEISKARKIKAYLAMKGITQAEVARSVGLDRRTVNTYILGRSRSKQVRKGLLKYGVPARYLR